MRLLDRYLLRELLIPLAYCLSGFYLFWLSSDLFAELRSLQEKKLQFGDIALLYLVRSPEFLVIVLPIALLLALLYSLTNHTRHHEITAIRAAGISLWRLSLPYFGVGIACSLSLMALNELWVPNTSETAEAIKQSRLDPADGSGGRQVRNLGFTNTREGRLWQIGVFNLDTGDMLNPQVIWTRDDGSRVWIKAARAVYTNNVWVFIRLTQHLETTAASNAPPLIPLLETNAMMFPQFSETPEQIRSEVSISRGISLRRARKADIPVTEILNYLRLHPNPEPADRAWLFTKLHSRLAAPWTCVVVVLIAIPFGAASGRRNIFYGVAGSIALCVLYFFIQLLCMAFGTKGTLPPWLAGWLPNIGFGLAGLWMTLKVR